MKDPNKQYYVYILTNKVNTALYVGVTSNLAARVFQHKSKQADGFTKRYSIDKLVHYEIYSDAISAISREKQLKAGSRKKKIDLIEKENKEWRDLSDDL
ncbi:MAG: GIY-YIG nuclease family protein [bacterium]|nr:GIY-YIG nuclease family protein [bacterium]